MNLCPICDIGPLIPMLDTEKTDSGMRDVQFMRCELCGASVRAKRHAQEDMRHG